METKFRKISGTPLSEFPINPAVIPNNMGINLCNVEGMSWTRQADGQLVSLTIHFIPEQKEGKGEWIAPKTVIDEILSKPPEVLQKEGKINYAQEVTVKSDNFEEDMKWHTQNK